MPLHFGHVCAKVEHLFETDLRPALQEHWLSARGDLPNRDRMTRRNECRRALS